MRALWPRSDPAFLWIFATNIITGAGTPTGGASLQVGANSELKLVGTNVDLSNSGLESVPVWDEPLGVLTLVAGGLNIAFRADIASFDEYWGQGNFSLTYPLGSAGLWNGAVASAQSDPSPPSSQASQPFSISGPGLFADSDVRQLAPETALILTNYFGPHPFDPTGPPLDPTNVYTVRVLVPSNELKAAIFIGVPNGSAWSAGDNFGGVGLSGYHSPLDATVSAPIINAVTQLPELASFTIDDTLGTLAANSLGVIPNLVGCPTNGFRPRCYVASDREGAFSGASGNNGFPDPNFFTSTGAILTDTNVLMDAETNTTLIAGTYADYSQLLDNLVSRPKQIPAGTPTNNPGRVRIFADRLNLDNTRIRADGQIQISTPHLLSSSNAVIDCANISLDLSSTNGSLKVQNVAPQGFVSRFNGQNFVWSAVWSNSVVLIYQNFSISNLVVTNIVGSVTNVVTNLIPVEADLTNIANVNFQTLMVDGQNMSDRVAAHGQDFATHSPDVVLNDTVSVLGSLVFQGARSLTLNGGVTPPRRLPGQPGDGSIVGQRAAKLDGHQRPKLALLYE